MTEAAGQRLQKALAHLGLASRREVEAWIKAGRLTVNGAPATLGMRVIAADKVRLDGRLVRQRVGSAIKVFVVHRSPGVEMRELLQSLPRSGGRRFVPVSPMPTIDGGLELVSSDGETAERLQRGVRRLSADFSVRVHGELSAPGVERVLQGRLDNGTTVTAEKLLVATGRVPRTTALGFENIGLTPGDWLTVDDTMLVGILEGIGHRGDHFGRLAGCELTSR